MPLSPGRYLQQMNSQTDPPLDYERLVSEYNHDLFHVLRGHRSLEYLEMWVPDEDPIKSLLNMVEAAEMAGRTSIAIRLGARTAASVDAPALRSALEPLGTVDLRTENDELIIAIGALGGARG